MLYVLSVSGMMLLLKSLSMVMLSVVESPMVILPPIVTLPVEGFHEVRIGKRFELHVDGPATESHLADARKMADDLLSNGVIEDVLDVRVEDSPA